MRNDDNSDAQSSCGENKSTEEERLKKFVKSMLVSSLFIGTFVEKRLVRSINEYRHIIKVSHLESDFINHLKVSKQKLRQFYAKKRWIGITDDLTLGSPTGYNVWTTLSECDEKFGTYWFKIKGVHFYYNEVKLKVKIVRPYVRESDVVTSDKDCSRDLNESLESFNKSLSEYGRYIISEVLTVKNVMDAVLFMLLLTFSLVTGTVQMVHYLLEYTLKLAKVLNEMIVALTPAWIALVNATSNVIFGLYKLVAYLFKPEQRNVMVLVNPQGHVGHANSPPRYPVREISNGRYTPVYYNDRYRRTNVRIMELP